MRERGSPYPVIEGPIYEGGPGEAWVRGADCFEVVYDVYFRLVEGDDGNGDGVRGILEVSSAISSIATLDWSWLFGCRKLMPSLLG